MRGSLAALAALIVFGAGQAQAETYQLEYDAAVLGVIVLGQVSYGLANDGAQYSARAGLQTTGLARLFDQTTITATAGGVLPAQGVAWQSYALDHAYANKSRRTQLTRQAGQVSATITPRYSHMGHPPATPAQQTASFDPLSAVFVLGRQVAAQRACAGNVLVFDGRQHYRLTVSRGEAVDFNGGGYSGPAARCEFRYTPIAGFNADMDANAIPVATAWFGLPNNTAFAPVLRLEVPTPLGTASLNLRTFQRTP